MNTYCAGRNFNKIEKYRKANNWLVDRNFSEIEKYA